jgi:hypothetical protein
MYSTGIAMPMDLGVCAYVFTKRRRQESRRTLRVKTRRETFAVLATAALGVAFAIVASLTGN